MLAEGSVRFHVKECSNDFVSFVGKNTQNSQHTLDSESHNQVGKGISRIVVE